MKVNADISGLLAYDYVCGFCGKHDYALRLSEEESLKAAEEHLAYCSMNPENERCGSCDHFKFAKKLIPVESDYEYGIPENVQRNLRLCNYVGVAVEKGCDGCKNHRVTREGK